MLSRHHSREPFTQDAQLHFLQVRIVGCGEVASEYDLEAPLIALPRRRAAAEVRERAGDNNCVAAEVTEDRFERRVIERPIRRLEDDDVLGLGEQLVPDAAIAELRAVVPIRRIAVGHERT